MELNFLAEKFIFLIRLNKNFEIIFNRDIVGKS
jgi:hypothetical protein